MDSVLYILMQNVERQSLLEGFHTRAASSIYLWCSGRKNNLSGLNRHHDSCSVRKRIPNFDIEFCYSFFSVCDE